MISCMVCPESNETALLVQVTKARESGLFQLYDLKCRATPNSATRQGLMYVPVALKLDNSATETLTMIKKACRKYALSEAQVFRIFRWHKTFKEG